MHTRTVLREADFLITVSDDLRKKAVAMGASPEKTRAIVNGCDLSVFHVRDRLEARQKLHIDPAAEAVVYIGRMDVKKGLRELVEARGIAASSAAQPACVPGRRGTGQAAHRERHSGQQRCRLHSRAARLCIRRGCRLDGGSRSGYPAKLYGRLPECYPGGARLWPSCRRHKCRGYPRDHERRVRMPRAASRAGRVGSRLGIGPRQNLGRCGHLRASEPKLEYRRGGTARDLRIAGIHPSGTCSIVYCSTINTIALRASLNKLLPARCSQRQRRD